MYNHIDLVLPIIKKNGLSAFPRSPKTVAKLLNESYSNKRILFYGGGGHTREVLSALDKSIEVLAILDDKGICGFDSEVPVLKTCEIANIDFDYVVISNSLYFDKMFKVLLEYVKPEKILNFYTEENIDLFLLENKILFDFSDADPNKQNLLLIVPFENGDHITRGSDILKGYFNLYKVYYIAGADSGENTNFLSSVALGSSALLLFDLLSSVSKNIDVVVINAIPSIYHVFDFVSIVMPEKKIYISILDVLSFFGEKEKITKDLEFADRYDYELECEHEMFVNADGIIASVDGVYAESDIFSKCNKYIRYLNYLPADYCVFNEAILDNKDIKLCYAGGVLPTAVSKAISEDIKMIKVFQPSLEEGFSIECYFSPGFKPMVDAGFFDDYKELAATNNRFKICGSLPQRELLPAMSKSHFGIMFYDFTITEDLGVIEKHSASVVPTKIFSYLFAGLPILISSKFIAAADFLRSNGVAIVVEQSDIGSITKLIEQCDYSTLKQNVKRFQSEYALEKQVDRLIKFLGR